MDRISQLITYETVLYFLIIEYSVSFVLNWTLFDSYGGDENVMTRGKKNVKERAMPFVLRMTNEVHMQTR